MAIFSLKKNSTDNTANDTKVSRRRSLFGGSKSSGSQRLASESSTHSSTANGGSGNTKGSSALDNARNQLKTVSSLSLASLCFGSSAGDLNSLLIIG
jgi:hypothetical protein